MPFRFLILLLGSVLMGGVSAWARPLSEDLKSLESVKVFRHRIFFDCHYCIPNEHEFYLFESSLQKKGDVVLSIGTFRAFENASRGSYDHGFAIDIDETATQFNQFHIKSLAAAPEAVEFIPKFLREPQLYVDHPELRELFMQGRYRQMALLLGSLQRPGKPRFRGLPLERYVIQLLRYCAGRPEHQRSFLCDPIRYERLHRMASEERLHALRIDVGRESMAALNQVLIRNGLKVRTFDLSNVSDYIPFERIDGYRKNLRNVPWSEGANVQMTIMPSETSWDYYNWKSADFVAGLRDFEIEGDFADQMSAQLPKAELLTELSFLSRVPFSSYISGAQPALPDCEDLLVAAGR